MIKLENTCVMNLENALRGARNPMSGCARPAPTTANS